MALHVGVTPSRAKAVLHVKDGTYVAMRLFHNGESDLLKFNCSNFIRFVLTRFSRNCTKHQVRCDYRDTECREETLETTVPTTSASTLDINRLISQWQKVGVATLGELSLDLQEQRIEYSTNDLRMVYFVLQAGQSAESQEFTVWTNTFSQ